MYRKQCAVHGLVMCTGDENAANVCAGVRDFRFRRGEPQRPAPAGHATRARWSLGFSSTKTEKTEDGTESPISGREGLRKMRGLLGKMRGLLEKMRRWAKKKRGSWQIYKGRSYKLVSKVGRCFYLTWMSLRLSHSIFFVHTKIIYAVLVLTATFTMFLYIP